MKKISVLIIGLVILSSCSLFSKSVPTKNCIDNLITCKKEFNISRQNIMMNRTILKELLVKYNKLGSAINTELNILLTKSRENKGKPFESCDTQVELFCNDVSEYKKMYELNSK